MRVWRLTLIAVMFTGIWTSAGSIIPKDWMSPEDLDIAEQVIQTQLDTGQGMGPTAWGMAKVKDARLLLIYLKLYEGLPDEVSRTKLLSEQAEWLKRRKKAVEKLAVPDGGSAVTLDTASKHIELTDERIQELQKRLDLMKNVEPSVPANGESPVTLPTKAGAASSDPRR